MFVDGVCAGLTSYFLPPNESYCLLDSADWLAVRTIFRPGMKVKKVVVLTKLCSALNSWT